MLKVAGGGLEEFILHYPSSLYTCTYSYCFSATYSVLYILLYPQQVYIRILVFAKNLACFAKIRQKYLTFASTKIHKSLVCANKKKIWLLFIFLFRPSWLVGRNRLWCAFRTQKLTNVRSREYSSTLLIGMTLCSAS